jgi:hypothetical protein
MRAAIPGAAIIAALGGRAGAEPAPDFVRAAELYKQASDEMTAGQLAEAARDFGAAYELIHDPILLLRVAAAYDKAGGCTAAIEPYRTYLTEAKLDDPSRAIAERRVVACGASERPSRPHGSNTAWLLVGGAIAFVTTGAVLAYSASSSEQDIRDLYAGTDGKPPTYDTLTAQRYHDLIDQGHRYEELSWVAFGLGSACGLAAGILFWKQGPRETLVVTPLASPHSGGVSASLRF